MMPRCIKKGVYSSVQLLKQAWQSENNVSSTVKFCNYQLNRAVEQFVQVLLNQQVELQKMEKCVCDNRDVLEKLFCTNT